MTTFGTWVLAERFNLSAILAVVTLAMTIAHHMPSIQNARHRIASNSVWESMVFFLNVLAFLLMGLQARHIVLDLWSENLGTALFFSGAVFATVVFVRLAWVFAYGSVTAFLYRRPLSNDKPQTVSQNLVAGWCGIRGLVTMATALALPADFPSRDIMQLCALAVVLGTLIVQGLTLGPLLRRLQFKVHGDDKQFHSARRAG